METKIQIKSVFGEVLFELKKENNTTKNTLEGAVIKCADLTGADLTGADLTGADLTGADLTGADLTGADLTGADLRGVDLTGADLRSADLTGADLTGADLTGADLTGADLTGADLTGADLTGADLRGAKNLSKIYQSSLSILSSQVNSLRAFKFLDKKMQSPISENKITYEIGKIYSEKVDNDKLNLCGEGLNVATLEWCIIESNNTGKKGNIFIEVEFDPKNMVMPYFSDGKFRVSKFKVIRIVPKNEIKKASANI